MCTFCYTSLDTYLWLTTSYFTISKFHLPSPSPLSTFQFSPPTFRQPFHRRGASENPWPTPPWHVKSLKVDLRHMPILSRSSNSKHCPPKKIWVELVGWQGRTLLILLVGWFNFRNFHHHPSWNLGDTCPSIAENAGWWRWWKSCDFSMDFFQNLFFWGGWKMSGR